MGTFRNRKPPLPCVPPFVTLTTTITSSSSATTTTPPPRRASSRPHPTDSSHAPRYPRHAGCRFSDRADRYRTRSRPAHRVAHIVYHHASPPWNLLTSNAPNPTSLQSTHAVSSLTRLPERNIAQAVH